MEHNFRSGFKLSWNCLSLFVGPFGSPRISLFHFLFSMFHFYFLFAYFVALCSFGPVSGFWRHEYACGITLRGGLPLRAGGGGKLHPGQGHGDGWNEGKKGQQLHLSAICRKSWPLAPAICIITNAHVSEARFLPQHRFSAFHTRTHVGFLRLLDVFLFSWSQVFRFRSAFPTFRFSALPPVAAERFLPTNCNFGFVLA